MASYGGHVGFLQKLTVSSSGTTSPYLVTIRTPRGHFYKALVFFRDSFRNGRCAPIPPQITMAFVYFSSVFIINFRFMCIAKILNGNSIKMIYSNLRLLLSALLLACLLILPQRQSVDAPVVLATKEKVSVNQSSSIEPAMKNSMPSKMRRAKPATPGISNGEKGNPLAATSSQAKETPPDVWMLCELNERTTSEMFRHFPHASQTLLPCWSWFQRMRRQLMVSSKTSRCAFYVQNPERIVIKPGQWVDELIKHMGCSLISSDDPLFNRNHTESSVTKSRRLYFSYPFAERPFQYFETPEDARTLRSQVLRSMDIPDDMCTYSRNLRIAIINRRKSRSFLNVEIIFDALRQAYPSVDLEVAFMEDMTASEQFKFWAQHDVIIAGHGAALTALFLMPPCRTSSIIEIFPHHYYSTHFDNLRKTSGIRWYGYYDNLTEDAINFERATFMTLMEERGYYRSMDFDTSSEIILDLVRQALSGSSSKHGIN